MMCCLIVDICMYVDFVPVWVESAGKHRNICGLVSWVGFPENCTKFEQFLCKCLHFPNVKTDCLYIYYVHYIGYSFGFLKTNLANIMYIVKF